jgi:aspartyl-tRNA(Asn)/glutamyl-tRNA(Gln) amidotransferase subunit A
LSPTDLTIAEARREIDSGRLSPIELVESTLAAIEEGEELNAYLHVDRDGARRAAGGELSGPLAGIPICVKDIIDVAGMPTTAGAAGWVRHPEADAPAVARLREAGAVIVGKGNTNEFAFGIDGQNPHWGDCHNPIDPSRMTGGSSSGPAAATASGQALAAVGTDTSGSLRVPASLCGLVSIRPTHGRVSTQGVVPLAWSYDTVGPIARTAADTALLLDVLAGGEVGRLERPADGLRGIRIGLLEHLLDGDCSRAVADGIQGAADLARSAGAEVVTVEVPRLAHTSAIHRAIQFSEASASHRSWFDDQRDRYAPGVRERIEAGSALHANDYLLAQRARALVRREAEEAMGDLDAVIGPASPVTAPPLGADDVDIDGHSMPLRQALLSFTVPLTQLGGPVAAIPIGEDDGLPFGAQVLGRPRAEARLLGIAAELGRLLGRDGPEG